MRKYLSLLILLLFLSLPISSWANFGNKAVQVQLIQEKETIQPGQPFWVALHFEIEKDWHIYWKNPGDIGMPLKIDWQLPSGFQAAPLEWPYPEKFTAADMVGFGYSGDVVLLSLITPPKNLEAGSDHKIGAQMEWLVCSALMCQPGSASTELTIKVDDDEPKLSKDAALFEKGRKGLPLSDVEITVNRNDGILQLQLPKFKDPVTQATFFPEEQEIVDMEVSPSINELKDFYVISLKEKEEGTSLQLLKGVLVLELGDSKQIEAIEVNSPIQTDAIALVTLAELPAHMTKGGGKKAQLDLSKKSFDFEGGVGMALLFAFLGGLILNLMPCVLPVISLKIMSFVKMAGEKRALVFQHGLWFSLGVLISFWVLAAGILLLRAYGQAVGWGFQLQEPIFVVILASLLFVFALSLFGVFEWGLIFASWAGQTQVETAQKSSGSFASSFFSGVLATAVATPCTGPFLGSAVGFALTLPAWQALLIFTSLGLGMCFPYLLLAAFPSFLKFIPKPGAWMETFKQLMGFVLLATVLWLMWVFSAQTNSFSVICLVAGFLCFAFGAWIYGRGGGPAVSKTKRILAYVSVVACFVIGFQAILLPRPSWSEMEVHGSKGKWAGWETFSPQRVAELRAQGVPVLIDFTARWCLICQTNHMVLASDEVDQKMNQLGVVKMVADWTKNDPVITEELSKFGRNSVPLYVLYGPEQEQDPVILPQLLTPDVVAGYLDQEVNKQNIALR